MTPTVVIPFNTITDPVPITSPIPKLLIKFILGKIKAENVSAFVAEILSCSLILLKFCTVSFSFPYNVVTSAPVIASSIKPFNSPKSF